MKHRIRITSLVLAILLTLPSLLLAQNFEINHVEPLFWWTGMKRKSLQIMVHGKDISNAKITVSYPGVRFERKVTVTNPDYVFIYVDITNKAKPGVMPIVFSKDGKTYTYHYQLRPLNPTKGRYKGFNSSDVVYLIMPDRFSDGNLANDNVKGMLDKKNLSNPNGRHGGDLKGIENHLDYLKNLGVTTLWLTPLVENNMPRDSYHGYAATNLYKIDPRFGTNQGYVNFVKDAHKKGLKVIMDEVMNHIGSYHWWMKDLPTKNWVHNYKKYGQTNYRMATISDPYASKYDQDKMEKGWFVKQMPDLNQSNPLEATYLIQNTLWWIEYSGIDGIRMDTYPYNNKYFMARWVEAIKHQFPHFNIVGEIWTPYVSLASYWEQNTHNKDGYNSHLPSITDYPLWYAINDAFTQNFGFNSGLSKIYYTLAQDFLYSNPYNNLIFLDDHDTSRFASVVKKNKNLFKMGMAFLLTTRGIPLIYYGDEIMMTGEKSKGDGNDRKDFPGGWPGDPHDAFKKSGRTPLQNEIFDYVRKLIHFRDNNPVFAKGRLMQFVPQNDTYVYFRYNKKETIMVIMNMNKKNMEMKTQRFTERMHGFKKAENVMTDQMLTNLSKIDVPAQTALVLKLEK